MVEMNEIPQDPSTLQWLYQTTDELRPFLAIDLFMKFALDDLLTFTEN
tara:strand:- start:519 stop:662 length:144 start_codon:yes stop_codon:yes gene_type:complete